MLDHETLTHNIKGKALIKIIENTIPGQLVEVEAAVPQPPLGAGIPVTVVAVGDRGCFTFALF